jgi:hypothetical protein
MPQLSSDSYDDLDFLDFPFPFIDCLFPDLVLFVSEGIEGAEGTFTTLESRQGANIPLGPGIL